MAINTEKNSYTVLFAIGMVLLVGSILAFVAMTLKPTISENQRLETQQNILYAMGVNNNDGSGGVNFVPATEVETDQYRNTFCITAEPGRAATFIAVGYAPDPAGLLCRFEIFLVD